MSNIKSNHGGDGADIRVLLFVQEGPAKQKYIDALSKCGAQVFVSTSFFDLSAEICNHTYHGLFLDVPSKMKAIRENRAYVYRLVERFPVSHVQIDGVSGEVRCFHVDRKFGSTLPDFINTQCRTFIPKKIRQEVREEVHLPVHVYKDEEDKRPERSITEDLSLGGCFVISSRRWKDGQDVLIRFKDITDPLPIRAHIKRVVKWGKPRQIPGIGVQFNDLSPLQAEQLAELLSGADDPR